MKRYSFDKVTKALIDLYYEINGLKIDPQRLRAFVKEHMPEDKDRRAQRDKMALLEGWLKVNKKTRDYFRSLGNTNQILYGLKQHAPHALFVPLITEFSEEFSKYDIKSIRIFFNRKVEEFRKIYSLEVSDKIVCSRFRDHIRHYPEFFRAQDDKKKVKFEVNSEENFFFKEDKDVNSIVESIKKSSESVTGRRAEIINNMITKLKKNGANV